MVSVMEMIMLYVMSSDIVFMVGFFLSCLCGLLICC